MEFKGTKGVFKEDLGIDELEFDIYQISICDEQYNVIGYAYGKDENECLANGKLFSKSKDLLEMIINAQEVLESAGFEAKQLIKETIEL